MNSLTVCVISPPELQWGRRCSAAEISELRLHRVWIDSASMGPPLFSGGNVGAERGRANSLGGFNGAAAVQRRKSVPETVPPGESRRLQWGRRCSAAEIGPGPLYKYWPVLLQWGRRCSAAEIGDQQTGFVEDRGASMGPPLFSGGNPLQCWPAKQRGGQLQWGRRCSAAEISPGRFLSEEEVVASMGPPLFSGGNQATRGCSTRREQASMGPPLFSGGNWRSF